MSKHTPEPWLVGEGYEQYEPGIYIWSEETDDVVISGDTEPGSEDARRIVACVNACKGLKTEYLENNSILLAMGAQSKDIEAQRDELLAALKEARADVARVESGKFCDLRETLREIDAAIAKCEAQS